MTEPMSLTNLTLAFGWPGGTEWIILLVLGLLIFGRRLPEVGRSLGRGIVEFKKGVKGIEDEVEDASSKPTPQSLPEEPRPKLTEQPQPPVQQSEVSQAKVGGEGENPYRPEEEGGAEA